MSMPFMFYALAVTPSRRLSRHGPDFLFHKKKKTLNYLSSNLVYYEKPRLKKTQKNRVR